MEVQKFQETMKDLVQSAQENGGTLTKDQIQKIFGELELQEAQIQEILRYLRLQGIHIEGVEEMAVAPDGALRKEESDAPQTAEERLPKQERAYFRAYRDSLAGEAMEELLLGAADIAAELYRGELPLADLIQEANVSLFLALERREDESDAWVYEEVRRGLRRVIAEQQQRSFGDDCLVEKVKKLDEAVKELSEDEDGEETPFSVNELAIILDMEPEEMRDILRLTGDEN